MYSLYIIFLGFLLGCQGGSINKRGQNDNDCQLVSKERVGNKFQCVIQRKCEGNAAGQPFTMYNCPKPVCERKVKGDCGWDVCACVDHRGISQVGRKEFIYGDLNTPGVKYKCSCFQDAEIQRMCGTKCEIFTKVEKIPQHEPRPPPTFPPYNFNV